MKKLILVLFVLCSYVNAGPCSEELNAVHREIIKNYRGYKHFLNRYIMSHKRWAQYYQSVLDLEYPDSDERTVKITCSDIRYEKMACTRLKIIKQYLKSPIEGELCPYIENYG